MIEQHPSEVLFRQTLPEPGLKPNKRGSPPHRRVCIIGCRVLARARERWLVGPSIPESSVG